MHGSLKLGGSSDIVGPYGEVGVLLKALGGDYFPEQINNGFRLRGDLHLACGVEKKITPVILVGIPEVIGGAPMIEFHADETQLGIHEVFTDMRHVGNMNTVEDTIGGMGNGFVEAVFGNPDRGGPDIEFADIDRIEC